jgi:hypothetical protein
MGRIGRTGSSWSGAPNAGDRLGMGRPTPASLAVRSLKMRRSFAGATRADASRYRRHVGGAALLPSIAGASRRASPWAPGVLGPIEARAVCPSSRRDHDPRYQKPPSKQPPLRWSASSRGQVTEQSGWPWEPAYGKRPGASDNRGRWADSFPIRDPLSGPTQS